MRNYLGLAISPHDPALAIVDSRGELAFAEAAERYVQNKRAWNAVPDDLIRIDRLIARYVEPGADLVLCCSWRRPTARSVGFTGLLLLPCLRKVLSPESYVTL